MIRENLGLEKSTPPSIFVPFCGARASHLPRRIRLALQPVQGTAALVRPPQSHVSNNNEGAMWTVVVEMHPPEGGSLGLFQLGEWHTSREAYSFAQELEWKLGEHKITAHVVFSSVYVRRWMDLMNRAHIRFGKSNRFPASQLPPCDYDDE